MIGPQQKLASEQEHSEVLHRANDCIHLQLVCCVVPLRASEGPTEEPDRMLESSVLEVLLEHRAEGDATCVCLEDETVLRIRHAHDARLEQLLLELLKAGVEGWSPLDDVGPRRLVERIADVRKRRNQIAIVATEAQKRCQASAFLRFRPLLDLLELPWLRVDASPRRPHVPEN